jgi:hypothetical protein
MISLDEFFKIFKDTDFSREKLAKFYKSIRKSVILFYAGKKARPQLLKLERESQWPILQKIDDYKLNIYKGADPILLSSFIKTIKDEKNILLNRQKISKNNAWRIFNAVIETRIKLYGDIFGFTKKDKDWCKKAGERYENILLKKRKNFLLKSSLGIIAAGAIGTGIYFLAKRNGEK